MTDPSQLNHPHCSTPEEYEEYQAAMNELCDQIEAETPDPQPENLQQCPNPTCKCRLEDYHWTHCLYCGTRLNLLPKDFDDWVKQGNEHFKRRFHNA